MPFSIAGVEITQGIQYYHSNNHLKAAYQCPDNSLPLVAHKPTLIRVYLETSSGPAKAVTGTVSVVRKVGDHGEWRTLGPVSQLAQCTPVAKGTDYRAVRGSLNSSLNFLLPSEWVAGEMKINITATDGAETHTQSAPAQATLRQTLKIAAITVEGNIGGTKVPAPSTAKIINTLWKAARILPISDEIQVRIVGTVTMPKKLDDQVVPDPWGDLRDKAVALRLADGNQAGWFYYVFIPPSLVVHPLGMKWGSTDPTVDGLVAGRAMEANEGYDAVVHETLHACGRLHSPYGAPDPDPQFPHYESTTLVPPGLYDIGSIGEYGVDVVDKAVISPIDAHDIMGYSNGSGKDIFALDKYYLWISPYTYSAVYNYPLLNPQPAEWPNEIFRGRWTTGWTIIVPFELGGKPHLFSYKSVDHSVAIDRIRDDGRGTTNAFTGSWKGGWTHIVPFQLGGKPHLFCYKSGDGTLAIDRVLDAGNGTKPIPPRDKWSPGWTNIVVFQLGGKPHLFRYRAEDGSVSIDRIRDDGSGTDNVSTTTWSLGWTNIVAFELGGKPHLFSYKAGNGGQHWGPETKDAGRVDIDRINDDAKGTTHVSSTTWTTGWTDILALHLNGKPHLFSHKGDGGSFPGGNYKDDAGKIALDRISPDGKGFTNLFTAKWRTGWTNIVAFQLAGTPYLLSYKTDDGTVAIDRVNG